jgi:hypothetical protein
MARRLIQFGRRGTRAFSERIGTDKPVNPGRPVGAKQCPLQKLMQQDRDRKENPSWRRLAQQLNSDTEQESKYAARIAERVSPGGLTSIEEIEREVMTEMAGSLGKTGEKCTYKFMLLEKQGILCDALVAKGDEARGELREAAIKFNELRKGAEDARRDLIIQRQAVHARPFPFSLLRST